MTQPLPLRDETLAENVRTADRVVIGKCLRGDDTAWATLLSRYKNLIFSIPIKYGLTREEAADIFQSVCVDLLCDLRNLRDSDALSTWLIHVTYNKCFHQARLIQKYDVLDEQLEPLAAAEAIPGTRLQELEREQTVRIALDSLNSRCRKLMRLLFFESPSRSYEEISRSMFLPTGSIGPIRRRCLDKLRKHLEKAGFP
jgi:RNA polymerase sigma factor (sigma-70 family)